MEDDPKPIKKRGFAGRHHNPGTRERMSKAIRRALADPEVHKRQSEAANRQWADPEARQRHSQGLKRYWTNNSESRKRIGEASKQGWADPQVRKRRIRGMKRAWKNPEVRQRLTAAIRRIRRTPESRKRSSEIAKRTHADPEVRKRISEATRKGLADPKVRRRISQASKRSWANNPTWRNETSERTKGMWVERRTKLARALPTDWRDKPPSWWIIGMELLSKDYLSNSELAGRLDASNILKCPYEKTWELSVNNKACSEFIRRIRSWVGKPGKILRKSAA